jgi:hypothetical protein
MSACDHRGICCGPPAASIWLVRFAGSQMPCYSESDTDSVVSTLLGVIEPCHRPHLSAFCPHRLPAHRPGRQSDPFEDPARGALTLLC